MGRIFSNTPMEGKPLALRGLARGWRLLEEAWESLEIIGGHVEWRNGRNGLIPRIVIDSTSSTEDEERELPWDCTVVDTDIIVNIGRVYEYNTVPMATAPSAESSIAFVEWTEPNGVLRPNEKATLTPTTTDYICICSDSGNSDYTTTEYSIELESSNKTVIQRLAKVTVTDGVLSIEQIHVGDVTFTRERVSPFKLAIIETDVVMYVPSGSVVVNGQTLSPAGLTASSLSDWLIVTSFTSGLNLYLVMGSNSGTFGSVSSASFSDIPPSTTAEVITIPILIAGGVGLVSVQNGGIVQEYWRPDDHATLTASYKSMEAIATGSPYVRKSQLNGFIGYPAPSEDPFVGTTPARLQHIALREENDDSGADLRWYNLRTLISGITDNVKDDLLSDTEWLESLGDALDGYTNWDSDWNSSVTHTGMDFSGSTSAKGTGLSGGNTDHDDSYWHEAGLIASPFTDTKNYVTSGAVRVGAFALEGSPTTNKWDALSLGVTVSNGVYLLGSGTATLYLGNLSSESGNFTDIFFNGELGLDLAGWTTKGGLTGATIQEIAIQDAQPSDKILVIRG